MQDHANPTMGNKGKDSRIRGAKSLTDPPGVRSLTQIRIGRVCRCSEVRPARTLQVGREAAATGAGPGGSAEAEGLVEQAEGHLFQDIIRADVGPWWGQRSVG